MAISAGAMIRKFGVWLTVAQTMDKLVERRSPQPPNVLASHIGWGALDEWEVQQTQRVRKAGVELMKFQTVHRGY